MNNTLQEQTTGSRVAVYYELTKPKIWYLLVFTAFGAALTASNIYNIPISIETWALMLFSDCVYYGFALIFFESQCQLITDAFKAFSGASSPH